MLVFSQFRQEAVVDTERDFEAETGQQKQRCNGKRSRVVWKNR